MTEPSHPTRRATGHPHRFRELLERLLHFASQGFTRTEFLRLTAGFLLEFSSCDQVEMRIEDGERTLVCTCVLEAGGTRLDVRTAAAGGPPPAEGMGTVLDWIAEEVLRGRFAAAPPFATRSGSFWTGDAARPVVLWSGAGSQTQPRSAVIGGLHPSLAVLSVPVDETTRGVLILASRRPDFLAKEDVHFYEAVAEAVGVAIAFHASQWALRERVKELTCLYGIAKLANQADLDPEERLRAIAAILPPGWQFPEITTACITLDGVEYATPDFEPGPWVQSAPVEVHGRPRGRVRVAYGREMPEFDEGPFLREERSLIDEVARQVGFIVERAEVEAEKARLRAQLGGDC
jgi:hypothetical protein